MANTYTQIYLHLVFAVARREALIGENWAGKLHTYLAGICRNRHHFVHAINGVDDHVHLLVGMHPAESVASLVKELKGQSTRWINDNYLHGAFSWQSGYAAFSVSQSLVEKTTQYITHQEDHHRKRSFKDEYLSFLELYNIRYDERYVFSD